MKKFWPFLFYFWQFAGVAFMAAFVVLYFQQLGFDGPQIGILTGLAPLLTLFSAPLWTGLADATHQHRLVMSLTILGGSITVFVFPLLTSFLPILVIVVLSSILLAPMSPFADSATISMLADERNLYGRLRLGGTFGYGLAAPIAGWLVQIYGLGAAFWGCALMYFLAFLTSQKLTHTAIPNFAQAKKAVPPQSRVWLFKPRWLLFLLAAFGGGFAMAFSNSYFFPYMKALGAQETLMGFALTVGTIVEVPVLFFGNHLLSYFKAYRLFLFSLVITGLRLLLFAVALNPQQALFIQLLNGLSFPAMWMAGVAYADENAPAGMSATAQGIFGAAVFGVGTAAGGFVGGSLLTSLGARGMSLIFGIGVLGVTAIVALAGRLLPADQPQAALAS